MLSSHKGVTQLISSDFGVFFFYFLHRQDYVSELFHYLQTSADSPQLLALLESFLFSVVRDVKHYASENQRLEDALKRYAVKPFLYVIVILSIQLIFYLLLNKKLAVPLELFVFWMMLKNNKVASLFSLYGQG